MSTVSSAGSTAIALTGTSVLSDGWSPEASLGVPWDAGAADEDEGQPTESSTGNSVGGGVGGDGSGSTRRALITGPDDQQQSDWNAWVLGFAEHTSKPLIQLHSSGNTSWLLELNATAAAGGTLPTELATPGPGQSGGPPAAPLLLYYRRDWWQRLVAAVASGDGEAAAALPPTWTLLAELLSAGLNQDLDGDGRPDHVLCADLMPGCKGWALLSAIFASMAQTNGTKQGVWFNTTDLRPLIDSPAMPAALRLYAALASSNAALFTPGGRNVSRSSVPVDPDELLAAGGAVDAASGAPLCGSINPLFAAGRCLFTIDWATAALRLTPANEAGLCWDALRWVLDDLAAAALGLIPRTPASLEEVVATDEASALEALIVTAVRRFKDITYEFPYPGILMELYWAAIGFKPPQRTPGGEAGGHDNRESLPRRVALPVGAALGGAALVGGLACCVWALLVARRSAGQPATARTVKPPGPGPATTLALTDVQNSTLLWEVLTPELMDECLSIHHCIMRQSIEANYGYEVFTEGDAFAVAFHSPEDALGFALQVQAALLTAEWPPELLEHPDGCEVWARRNTHLQAPAATPLLSPLATLTGLGTSAAAGTGFDTTSMASLA
ncbi:hypothetical protein GPECTOR_6g726 [Gonium pectorale]|uniref:Guanylate cyclase domain-containing protein n=1 Tax=Gonium pectorale TaxID=33097 RepID=A0A150GVU1_GONPE|nr:hypothetical protein GPECTOR_6g726 [Gonium pectorale]|eukprot:KXZ53808.1 hypothetical protein GPECTOR_6g726 [Gonium pectorale]